ncbi:MAG TPA: TetR/AcrR family transcriptional regulator [Trebonia sp.]|nr:TetR/AcrR family transcriptional regulator [Trebonia sp.]
MTAPIPRTPGRPRSEASRQAILAAAMALTAEAGYAELTIEGIAARAGVGKQTIYRWWPTKADVLLEAGAAKADLHVPVTDQGSYRADLRAFLEASYAIANLPPLAGALRALMAEAQLDPAFGERFRVSFLERRREAVGVITSRALERGDLPGQPEAATVADIVFGTIWYRILATRRPLDAGLVEDLLAVLAPAAGAGAGTGAGAGAGAGLGPGSGPGAGPGSGRGAGPR